MRLGLTPEQKRYLDSIRPPAPASAPKSAPASAPTSSPARRNRIWRWLVRSLHWLRKPLLMILLVVASVAPTSAGQDVQLSTAVHDAAADPAQAELIRIESDSTFWWVGWLASFGLVGCGAVAVIWMWRPLQPPAAPRISIERMPCRYAAAALMSRMPPRLSEGRSIPRRRPLEVILRELAQRALTELIPASNPLRVGFATHKGFVRERNEDRVIAFQLGERVCLVNADGMGGEEDGEKGSRSATYGAALELTKIYGGLCAEFLHPEAAAALALAAAQREIQRATGGLTQPRPRTGCRTTLLVAVADGDQLGFAYLGDGGGCIVRNGGAEVESFVTPMKVAPGSNVICGSLGPIPEGCPQTGSCLLHPGDLVLLGTDGVFDRVRLEDLGRSLAEAVREFDGHLGRALKAILADLADQRDPHGHYICDDNMSLAALVAPLQQPVDRQRQTTSTREQTS